MLAEAQQAFYEALISRRPQKQRLPWVGRPNNSQRQTHLDMIDDG